MFAKKSLGQNFLISPGPIRLMIKEARVSKEDSVLEIGPGRGILTKALLETGARVVAVEKDTELIPLLQETFATEIATKQLTLVHADILELDLNDLPLTAHRYKLLANIPYYITGEIIRLFLESPSSPSLMALLVQKEVAERIAQDKKQSILSISVKVYGTPRYLGTVKRGLFRPIPNVDSAVLLIDSISKNSFATISEKAFFTILKAGFAHKRKKLSSNLKEVLGAEKVLATFESLGLNENTRAEEVSLEMWKKIAEKLSF